MDNFGTQSGFEDLAKMASKFEEGNKLFETTTGKFVFGALAFKNAVESKSFKNFGKMGGEGFIEGIAGAIKDVRSDFAKAFAPAQIIDKMVSMFANLEETRISLRREFGNDIIRKNIIRATKETQALGIGMERNLQIAIALSHEFRSANRESAKNLITTSSLVSQVFSMSDQASARMVANVSRFGGLKPKEIESLFSDIASRTESSGFSMAQMGENMESISDKMYRFDLYSESGKKNFKDMLMYSEKMGTHIGKIIDATDAFRHIPEAVKMSAEMSRYGINMAPTQLLASARGGDPTVAMRAILDKIAQHTDPKSGMMSQIGIDLADKLGPMINMNREDIQRAIVLAKERDISYIEASNNLRERAKIQQTLLARVNNTLSSMLLVVSPLANGILNVVDWLTRQTWLLKSILGILIATYTLLGARNVYNRMRENKEAVKTFFGKRRPGMMDEILEGSPQLSMDRAAKLTPNQQIRMMEMQNNPKAIMARANMVSATSKVMLAQAGQMLAASAMMIAFAKAIEILSVAYANFGKIDAEGIKKGVAVTTLFTLAMVALGRLVTVSAGPLLAMGALMLAFSGSVLLLGVALDKMTKPLQTLGKVDLLKVAAGITAVGMSLLAMGAIVTAGGLIGGVLMGAGMLGVAVGITTIGKVAELYADPIEQLGKGTKYLAEGLREIADIDTRKLSTNIKSLSGINYSKLDAKKMEILSNEASRSFNSKSQNRVVPIQNHLTIEIDGKVLKRKVFESKGAA